MPFVWADLFTEGKSRYFFLILKLLLKIFLAEFDEFNKK